MALATPNLTAQTTASQVVDRSFIVPAALFLIVYGFAEALIVYIWNPWSLTNPASLVVIAFVRTVYAVATAAVIVAFAQAVRPLNTAAWAPWAVMALGFAISAIIAQTVLAAWPNSGDEYGYGYVADTLLRGRLWNPGVPPELSDVLQTGHMDQVDGKRVSQYPPGWPALLSIFKLASVGQYANAFIGLVAALFLWLALRRVRVPDAVRLGVFILGTLAPFTIFQNASFFNHSLTAACLAAIVWLDLRDADLSSGWNPAGIGFAFSLLLVTRYETFLLAFPLFLADGLIRKRLRFVAWALPAAAAGLPVVLLFLAYNWRITGNPFLTTLAWVSPEVTIGLNSAGTDGQHSLARGLAHTVGWGTSWQDFASVLLMPLYAVAVTRRIFAGTVRWFDLLLPAVIVFFVFYSDFGGFQSGPRYWYFGHVALPVTIAAGLPEKGGLWELWRWRLDPMRLVLLQLLSFAGFTTGYAIFLDLQTGVRMAPVRVAAAAPAPALVLVPDDVRLRSLTWQLNPPHHVMGYDYTRNDLDGLGPVIIARDLGEDRTALLCRQVTDRQIFRMILTSPPPQGHLEPVCNGAH
jgi:hypothetical protein